MKILVIGSGGREHAIIKKIKQNKNVSEITLYQETAELKETLFALILKRLI